MSLKQQIDNDIKQAMLAKNKEALEALRSIKSMILLAETEKGGSGDISQEAESKLLMKAVKQRKESADIFQKEGRDDLARREVFQLDIISRYLPKQLSEEEIKSRVDLIQDRNHELLQRAGKALMDQIDAIVVAMNGMASVAGGIQRDNSRHARS